MKSEEEKLNLLDAFERKINDAFDEIMDVEGLSLFLHLDKPTIYALTSQRRIPFSKPTGKLLFLKSKILKWLEESEVKTVDQIQQEVDNNRLKDSSKKKIG